MRPKEVEELTKKTKNSQVLILSTKIKFPLFFADHVYFITIKNSKINRYEVLSKDNLTSFKSHYYKNYFKPFETYTFLSYPKIKYKHITIVKHVIGNNADKIIKVLEKEEYPKKLDYNKYLGPNSNTYAQWIIDQVPELNIKLPFFAYGKRFKL